EPKPNFTFSSLTKNVMLAAGCDGGAWQVAIRGLPCSKPLLSTVTRGTPTGTTITNKIPLNMNNSSGALLRYNN
ncbi:hypothetical protein GWI33_015515, partial [Rhynchophorus ferrugineus]